MRGRGRSDHRGDKRDLAALRANEGAALPERLDVAHLGRAVDGVVHDVDRVPRADAGVGDQRREVGDLVAFQGEPVDTVKACRPTRELASVMALEARLSCRSRVSPASGARSRSLFPGRFSLVRDVKDQDRDDDYRPALR